MLKSKAIANNLHACITHDTNPRSIKLAERLGFQREGHLRESRIENAQRYGLLYYGMLECMYSWCGRVEQKVVLIPTRPLCARQLDEFRHSNILEQMRHSSGTG